MDILELADPTEVWKAVEGDRSELITLLRSEKKLTQRTREALADWLEGSLQPVKLPKGRPPNYPGYHTNRVMIWDGHDPFTVLGWAGYRYSRYRRFIRKKGWHLKKAGRFYWSSERLRAKVAEQHGIDLDTFTNYMNRPKPKPQPFSSPDYIEWRRREIAEEIRHAKMRQKG